MGFLAELVSRIKNIFHHGPAHGGDQSLKQEVVFGGASLTPVRLEDVTLETAPLFSLPSGQLIPAKVLEVYDGDTLTAAVEIAANTFYSFRVRLEGVDTPELRPSLSEPNRAAIVAAAERARDFVRSLVLDKVVLISCNGIDKYGRTIGHVHLSETSSAEPGAAEMSRTVNELLIEKGLAKRYDGGKRDTSLPTSDTVG